VPNPDLRPDSARAAALGNYEGTVQVASNRKAVADSLAVTVHVVAPGGHIYWTGSGGIGRADLDASNSNGAFIPLASPHIPTGLASDSQHIYWTETSNSPLPSIGRANLDGTSADSNFIALPEPVTGTHAQPIGLAVDAQYIYWADPDVPAIGRANLDGTDVRPNFIPIGRDPNTGAGLGLPFAVAVDANHIYWTDQCRNGNPCATSAIGRANLDGSNINRDFIASDSTNGVTGIAVDGQHVYWANNYYSGGVFTAAIGRANLDGTNPNQALVPRDGTIEGMAVDTGFIYWRDNSAIARANLDGSNANPLFLNVTATFVTVGS
jgi:hypothetical protein